LPKYTKLVKDNSNLESPSTLATFLKSMPTMSQHFIDQIFYL